MRVKWVALAGGPIGILLIVGIAAAAAKFLGWSLTEGAVIGATVSVASTMVLARLLRDTGELATTRGRVMIGITLVEDLAVICMTVILPVLGGAEIAASLRQHGLSVRRWSCSFRWSSWRSR